MRPVFIIEIEISRRKKVSRTINVKYLQPIFTNSEKFVFTPIADIANSMHRLDKLLIKVINLSGILNKLFNIQKIKNRIKNHGIEKEFSFSFFDKNNKNKIKKGRTLTLIILTKVAIIPVCSLTEYPAPIT